MVSSQPNFLLSQQAMRNITGFQNLRTLDFLIMILNSQVTSIDGLGGLLHVGSVRTFMNSQLCYILNETPNEAYWQVRLKTH